MSETNIQFLLDEHVPPAVADGLRRRGIRAITANEAQILGQTDRSILAFAALHRYIVVTADDDYLGLAQQANEHAGIVYYHQRRHSIGDIVTGIELIHEVLPLNDLANRVHYITRAPGR